jgi:hypothetical protein
MQSIAVVVNMDSRTLQGFLAIQEGKRILDYLNERYPGSGEQEISPFLTLTAVKTHYRSGRNETAETLYVNNKAIRMVRTFGPDDARGNAVKNRSFPYMPKLPVKVIIGTQDSELIGYLHCREKQDIDNLLAMRKPFIPCTDVKIHNLLDDSWDEAAFTAVNSAQIISITRGETALAS